MVILFPIPPDVFRAGENGSPPGGVADNGLGLLGVDPFDPLKWDTFSSVHGDPVGDGDEGEGHGPRVVAMSPIRSPPHKELSPTGKL